MKLKMKNIINYYLEHKPVNDNKTRHWGVVNLIA